MWLGREDSNLRVAETASFQLHAHAGALRAKGPAAPGASGKRIHALYGTLARLAQPYPPCGSPALPESDGYRTHQRRDPWV
jgi:hypothetical protein